MSARFIGKELQELRYRAGDAMVRASSRSSFLTCSWFDHPLTDGTHSKGLFRACKFDAVDSTHFVQVSMVQCLAWKLERCRFIGSRIHHMFVKRTISHCFFEMSLIQHLSSKGVSHSRFELCRIRLHPMEASTWSNCHFQNCIFERIGDVKFLHCTFDGCRFPDGSTEPPHASIVEDVGLKPFVAPGHTRN